MAKKLWIGKEQEGLLKGIDTLFVGDYEISFNTIIDAIKKYKVQQVYFGAGICTKINQTTLKKVTKYLEKEIVLITAEVDINQLHTIRKDLLYNKDINFMITDTNRNYSLLENLDVHQTQIKIQSLQGKKIVALTTLYHFSKINTKKLNGKTYKGDKVLQ